MTAIKKNNISVNVKKLHTLTIGSLVIGMLITLFTSLAVLNKDIDHRIGTIRSEQVKRIEQGLKARIETAASILSSCYNEKHSRQECLDILNSIRYGKNNYVWIHTFDPNDISKATILAHPNKNFV
ncbi:MAG: hypothetical protein AB7E77_05720, partial [Desulfobulbus sp.]